MFVVNGQAYPVAGFFSDDGGYAVRVRLPAEHPMMRGMPRSHTVAARLSAGVLVCPD